MPEVLAQRSNGAPREAREARERDVAGLFGRQLPHSLEAEEYLLSCCFIDGSDTMARCNEERLEAEAFFAPANRKIFEKLQSMFERNQPLDLAVLAEEMKSDGTLDEVGGYPYLVQVSSKIPTTAQVDYFIERVRNLYLLRRLIHTAGGIATESFQPMEDVDEFFDKAEQEFFKITQKRVTESAKPMKETVQQARAIIAKIRERKGEMTGVTSGFIELDRMTFGFQRGEMIVLAARPSMGKTSLALNIAEHAAIPARAGTAPAATLIFSLEMSAASLAMRMLCSRAHVRYTRIRDGFCDNDDMDKLGKASVELGAAPIFIDDSSAISIMQLRAKARRLQARHKLGFIVVDYLQLLSPTDPRVPREQQVAEASRGLKALAKELDVPVLVLSQLNRSSEKEERKPRLSDLRESGSIEQDADVVLMLAKPPEARSQGDDTQVAGGMADLIVAKQRNGPVGELKLTFLRDITRFENYHQ